MGGGSIGRLSAIGSLAMKNFVLCTGDRPTFAADTTHPGLLGFLANDELVYPKLRIVVEGALVKLRKGDMHRREKGEKESWLL